MKEEFTMICDLDHRQNRVNGPCLCRPMTPEEWEKYGPPTGIKRIGYIISAEGVDRMLRNRGLKRKVAVC